MFQEFNEFIVKGNAFDLAVGVIIGGAFGAMAGSFVSDVHTRSVRSRMPRSMRAPPDGHDSISSPGAAARTSSSSR